MAACKQCGEESSDEAYHCQCPSCLDRTEWLCHFDCPFDEYACQGCKDTYLTEAETRFIAHAALGRH